MMAMYATIIFSLLILEPLAGFTLSSKRARIHGVLPSKKSGEMDQNELHNPRNSIFVPSRRHWIGTVAASLLLPRGPAKATLVQFPCPNGLMNTYHFMRAGQSMLEEHNLIATNPLFLTNRENGLSDQGHEQVLAACEYMRQHDINPSVVKFPLAANAMDTADLVSDSLHVGRNRLVPEYTYLDQRGVGRFDMLPLKSTEEAMWSLDVAEAGNNGFEGRPPPHDDGTPNETLGNQVTRLRQLLSLLETSLSGDDILLIFPDGTGPALLSALIADMPLNRVHEIQFKPGELRLDVNYESVRKIWPLEPSHEYMEAIQRGATKLEELRANPEDIINVRDAEYQMKQHIAEQEATQKREKAAAIETERRRLSLERQEAQRLNKKKRFDEMEAARAAQRAESQRRNPEMLELAVSSLLAGSVVAKVRTDASDARTAIRMAQEEAATKSKAEENEKPVESFDEIKTLEDLVEDASFELPKEEIRLPPSIIGEDTDIMANNMREFAHHKASVDEIFEYQDTTEEWLDWMGNMLVEEDDV